MAKALITPGDRIYVAGHHGMAGSAIFRSLKRAGYRDSSQGCALLTATREELDLLDPAAVKAWFSEHNPAVVVLAEAKVGGIGANNIYLADFLLENLKIQTHVIETVWRSGLRRLLFLGSNSIHPEVAEQPIREEVLLIGALEPANACYAIPKLYGIKLCHVLRPQHGLNAISLMPRNLYGPGDNYYPSNSYVIPALIRRFHEADDAKHQQVRCRYKSGISLQHAQHPEDCIEVFAWSTEHWQPGPKQLQILNAEIYFDHSIRALAEEECPPPRELTKAGTQCLAGLGQCTGANYPSPLEVHSSKSHLYTSFALSSSIELALQMYMCLHSLKASRIATLELPPSTPDPLDLIRPALRFSTDPIKCRTLGIGQIREHKVRTSPLQSPSLDQSTLGGKASAPCNHSMLEIIPVEEYQDFLVCQSRLAIHNSHQTNHVALYLMASRLISFLNSPCGIHSFPVGSMVGKYRKRLNRCSKAGEGSLAQLLALSIIELDLVPSQRVEEAIAGLTNKLPSPKPKRNAVTYPSEQSKKERALLLNRLKIQRYPLQVTIKTTSQFMAHKNPGCLFTRASKRLKLFSRGRSVVPHDQRVSPLPLPQVTENRD